jgi:serine/threonine protein kinase/tetratricopeptide (TPR) repeat protein
MPLAPKTRLGTYEILESLGAGGMGEVYRAQDLRLGRQIAVKVLPANAGDRLARFEREARTVAGLNHPNIVVLHSIEEEDGIRFLTMELVEGRTLSDLITPGGLPLTQILELSIPLADALVAAHERGVIHRDLKPGNVMVTREGRIKVLDFGLAKITAKQVPPALESHAATLDVPLSGEGQVLGTIPYMAPEQVRGDAADARSDLFAFGIILYELATGRRPFPGATMADIGSAILRDNPEPLTRVRPDLPLDLERVVASCLEKNPRERIQSALDLSNQLRSMRPTLERVTAEGGASEKVASIAVLPFVNRSRDADDEYFSDGLADELLHMLAKVRGLRIAARASSFYFKGKDALPADVGKALNVAALVDGSVRKAGDRVRISVQLIKVSDGSQLWSETYDRKLDDIFAVQDDIAQSVVRELGAMLFGELHDAPAGSPSRLDHGTVSRTRTYNPESYDLYLRGRYLFGATVDGPVRAQELFRGAIERSPRFALAYAGLGESYVMQSWLGSRDREITVSQAKGALAKALALDDQLCEARVLAAQIKLYFDWDWIGAEREHRAAVELDPGSDLAHRENGCFLSLMGQSDEGLAAARRAQTLDPLSVNSTHEVGYQLLTLGRLDEAAVEFRKAIDLNPTWIWGNIKLGMTYSQMDKHDQAMACVRRADELLNGAPGSPLAQTWLAAIESAAGNPTRVRGAITRLLAESRTGFVDPVVIAWLHYVLRDHDTMFASLERGYELRSPLMVFLGQLSRFLWREAGGDARYERLTRRMGLTRLD